MKDSIGNEMPETPKTKDNVSVNGIDRTLSIQNFLIAAQSAMGNGHTVIYSANEKRARVLSKNGVTSFLYHV